MPAFRGNQFLFWQTNIPCWSDFDQVLLGFSHYSGPTQYLQEPLIDSDGNKFPDDIIDYLKKVLPTHFWVTEFSLPNLYTANKHKLGDVIHASFSRGKNIKFIWGWLPGIAIPPSGAPWPITGHVPLYKTGLAIKPIDSW